MPTPETAPPSPAATDRRPLAMARLREGVNPFGFSVVTAGTDAECAAFDVPELIEAYLADLRAIVARYRDGRPQAQVHPVIGDAGTGKTHLLTRFVAELNRDAEEGGAESVVLSAGHIPPNLNGVDYLYRLLVNHLLASKGAGGRTLAAVSGRLTARLLGEALRQLAPHQQVGLIPVRGWWERVQLRAGSRRAAQVRLDAVAELARRCDAHYPRAEDLRAACRDVGLPDEDAVGLVAGYVERVEPRDAHGWARRELFSRLAGLALTGDRQPFDELHLGEVVPPHFQGAGSGGGHADGGDLPRAVDRWLLTVWLELLDELKIPVLLVFDQLEDEVRRATEAAETEAARAFTHVLASIINNVPDVCILLFSEAAVWASILRRAGQFAQERINQPFTLPGRAAQRFISMPDRIDPAVVERLIRRRVHAAFPDLDLTGLPNTFPFGLDDVRRAGEQPTIRMCIRTLARRYDEVVFRKTDPTALRSRLNQLWTAAFDGVVRDLGDDGAYTAAMIPETQTAIDAWLRLLHQEKLTGSGPWHRVELLHEADMGQYGYLNVVRTDGPDAPGVGIAAWLAGGNMKVSDLRYRLRYFTSNPCPVRTLVLLRRDGEQALVGGSRTLFDEAVAARRDVRVVRFESRHVHALFAVDRWRQAAGPEVESFGPDGPAVFREVLGAVSAELIGWIDSWRERAGGGS